MHSDQPGGSYSAILKDLIARRAALNSVITKLQAPQARSSIASRDLDACPAKGPGAGSGGGFTAN